MESFAKISPFLLAIFFCSCHNKRQVEINIDSKTAKFERLIFEKNTGQQFYKYSWSVSGYCSDTIELNSSKIAPGKVKFEGGPSEFYGDPPMKIIYDPLNARDVDIKIVYNFY